MVDSIRGSLPPVYGGLFNEFFDRPKVVETRATCDNCSMCDHGEASPVAMEFFNPETKCCTFTPILPNYLVGAILADESPEMAEGKRRIEQTIAKRIGVQPHQLTRPRKTSLIMTGYGDVFGRAKSLLCPYYDGDNPAGSCTIWRHREAICMTYYCKYSGGARGFQYWNALKNYLGFIQGSLSMSAATAVDPLVVEPKFEGNVLSLEDLDDLPPKDTEYAKWWGPWVGREKEFYLACHAWVVNEGPAHFHKIEKSKQGQIVFADLLAKYELLTTKTLPVNLVRSPRMKESHVGDKVVVTTYHRYDSFAVDKELFEVVGKFKSDLSLEENLAELREEGIELTPDLIEYLVAVGILVEPQKAALGATASAELNGRRAALSAVLAARGLPIDGPAQEKIDRADAETLDRWIKKAAVALALTDVIGGGKRPAGGARKRG